MDDGIGRQGGQDGLAAVAADAKAAEPVGAVKDELAFELATGALYHRARLGWYGGLHRVTMFVNLLASSAAVAAYARERPGLAIGVSAIVAIVSSLNLAFDLAGSARRHDECRRAYHDLAAALEGCEANPVVCREIRAKMIRAAGAEPAVFEAALHDAFNQAILSLGRHPAASIELSASQRLLRHIWPFRGTAFQTRAEREQAR